MKGLKDVLPEEDRLSVIKHIMLNRLTDWHNCAFAFAWGFNDGLCDTFSQKVTLSDLNLSWGFGPPRIGPWA